VARGNQGVCCKIPLRGESSSNKEKKNGFCEGFGEVPGERKNLLSEYQGAEKTGVVQTKPKKKLKNTKKRGGALTVNTVTEGGLHEQKIGEGTSDKKETNN